MKRIRTKPPRRRTLPPVEEQEINYDDRVYSVRYGNKYFWSLYKWSDTPCKLLWAEANFMKVNLERIYDGKITIEKIEKHAH